MWRNRSEAIVPISKEKAVDLCEAPGQTGKKKAKQGQGSIRRYEIANEIGRRLWKHGQ